MGELRLPTLFSFFGKEFRLSLNIRERQIIEKFLREYNVVTVLITFLPNVYSEQKLRDIDLGNNFGI